MSDLKSGRNAAQPADGAERASIQYPNPTEERKDLAVQLLQGCGASFINFFGRFEVERISR